MLLRVCILDVSEVLCRQFLYGFGLPRPQTMVEIFRRIANSMFLDRPKVVSGRKDDAVPLWWIAGVVAKLTENVTYVPS